MIHDVFGNRVFGRNRTGDHHDIIYDRGLSVASLIYPSSHYYYLALEDAPCLQYLRLHEYRHL